MAWLVSTSSATCNDLTDLSEKTLASAQPVGTALSKEGVTIVERGPEKAPSKSLFMSPSLSSFIMTSNAPQS
jgi:hypothetical protein